MNIRPVLVIAIAASLGAGGYLYPQNRALERDIAEDAERCADQLAQLESRYKAEIEALRQHTPSRLIRTTATRPGIEKPRFDQLVSYGHRVQAVTHKYEFLLESAQVSEAERKRLRRLLMERERLANAVDLAGEEGNTPTDTGIGTLQGELADVEAKIQLLLNDPLDYTRYEFLRQRSL